MKKNAFTLAEVLITLGIIGVVATITIPTIVLNYQTKAWDTASQVFEKKLEEALKVMNSQQTLAGYENTEDFVNELSQHLKITKICKNDDLTSCFEDKVTWGTDNKEIDMQDIKHSRNFGLEDWDTETIGLQFANGTTGIIVYNPDCRQDPYSNQIKGTDCLAILYDTSGFAKPNTQAKDLRSINVIKLGQECAFESGGYCYGKAFFPTPLSVDECEQYLTSIGLSNNCSSNGVIYFAGAIKKCGGPEHLAGFPEGSKVCTTGGGITTAYRKQMAQTLGLVFVQDKYDDKLYDDVIAVWDLTRFHTYCSVSGDFGGQGAAPSWYDLYSVSDVQAICKY